MAVAAPVARACTGAECYVQAATTAGAHRLTFRARLRGRSLRAGRYRLVLRATDAAGNRSAARRLVFTVLIAR